MSEPRDPVIVYVPVGLDASQYRPWATSTVTDLRAVGAVVDDEAAWVDLLEVAAGETLPESASGSAVVVGGEQPPTYLWVTMAQPSGQPTRLGDAILDTQLEGEDAEAPRSVELGEVYQRVRQGWRADEDGLPRLLQCCVTATTVEIPALGRTDVCLWFTSIDPVGADALQPAIAEIAVSPDLVTYLGS